MNSEQIKAAVEVARFMVQASNTYAGSDPWKNRLSDIVNQLLAVGGVPTGEIFNRTHETVTTEVVRLVSAPYVPNCLRKSEAPNLAIAA